MNDWAALDRALGAMATSGNTEIREDGEWLAELAGLQCEVRSEGKAPLVHLWSPQKNLTRRILRIRENSGERIVLEVQRFGRARPGRLEFLRTDFSRPAARVSREQFRARFGRLLSERFPDATVDSLTAAPDLEHSFSGVYLRGRMSEGSRAWAILAIGHGESAAAIEGILAFGILWLDWSRNRADRRAIEGVRMFIPDGASQPIRERCCALSTQARVEIFEFSENDGRIQKVDLADTGNLRGWLIPRQEIESACMEAREAIARIHPLALHMPPAGDEIGARLVPGTNEVALCFRGLDFGRWCRGEITFGIGGTRQKLTHSNETALDRLMQKLDRHRSPFATQPNHPIYRAAPERWLESIILADPTRLEAQLDPRHLYSQVPAVAAGDRGVLDILGVTRTGRLVVIELKASEDIQLAMQAIDYWLRVRRHQLNGDFERYGYFIGIHLDARPPLIWLVAPALRFHSATDTLTKYLSPEIQIARIGLSENWRHGIKVVFRQ